LRGGHQSFNLGKGKIELARTQCTKKGEECWETQAVRDTRLKRKEGKFKQKRKKKEKVMRAGVS